MTRYPLERANIVLDDLRAARVESAAVLVPWRLRQAPMRERGQCAMRTGSGNSASTFRVAPPSTNSRNRP